MFLIKVTMVAAPIPLLPVAIIDLVISELGMSVKVSSPIDYCKDHAPVAEGSVVLVENVETI